MNLKSPIVQPCFLPYSNHNSLARTLKLQGLSLACNYLAFPLWSTLKNIRYLLTASQLSAYPYWQHVFAVLQCHGLSVEGFVLPSSTTREVRFCVIHIYVNSHLWLIAYLTKVFQWSFFRITDLCFYKSTEHGIWRKERMFLTNRSRILMNN